MKLIGDQLFLSTRRQENRCPSWYERTRWTVCATSHTQMIPSLTPDAIDTVIFYGEDIAELSQLLLAKFLWSLLLQENSWRRPLDAMVKQIKESLGEHDQTLLKGFNSKNLAKVVEELKPLFNPFKAGFCFYPEIWYNSRHSNFSEKRMKIFLTTTQTHPPQIPLTCLLVLLAMVLPWSLRVGAGMGIRYGVGPFSTSYPNSPPILGTLAGLSTLH